MNSETVESAGRLLADHLFNDDLLLNDDDLRIAKVAYPHISYILQFSNATQKFQEYDKVAIAALRRVRTLGFTLIGASAVALLALATKPLWETHEIAEILGKTVELIGLIAASVSISGLWLASPKRRWLESRLMAERIRQWHFQLLLRRGKELDASHLHGPAGHTAFQNQRDGWFAQFMRDHERKLDSKLESISHDPIESVAWLHPKSPFGRNSAVLEEIFRAYDELRFEHQYCYAVFKLKTTTDVPIWKFANWPPTLQRETLANASLLCFFGAAVCSVLLIFGGLLSLPANSELIWRSLALGTAILGAALRAVVEGLGVDDEIDRYRKYRERIALLRDRFHQNTNQDERLHLMEEMELASVEEMQEFLRTHLRARFVLG